MIKRGELRGRTYRDKQGRAIRIIGADMLWPDGSKMLVEREGKQWGVDTEELLRVINSAQNAENTTPIRREYVQKGEDRQGVWRTPDSSTDGMPKPGSLNRTLGGLVDAWTLMPNSDREEIEEICPSLTTHMQELVKYMAD